MNEFFGQRKTVMLQIDENNPGYLKPAHKIEWSAFKLPFFDNDLPVIVVDDRQCWFPGYLVARYMGYTNAWEAINKNVFPIYKTDLNSLLNYSQTGELDVTLSESVTSNYSYPSLSLKDLPDELFGRDSLKSKLDNIRNYLQEDR